MRRAPKRPCNVKLLRDGEEETKPPSFPPLLYDITILVVTFITSDYAHLPNPATFVAITTIGNRSAVIVRYHYGGWSEEVNSCILISYMVYL
jgi:hypothetical protein